MEDPINGSKSDRMTLAGDGRSAQSSEGLEARGIGRRARGGDGWLFRELNISLAPGDRVALVGASGAGKTLLLRALAQLDPIDEGTVLWKGRAIEDKEIPHFRSQVTYLPQRPALTPGDVDAQLRFPFSLSTYRHRQFDRDRVVRILGELGRDPSFLTKSVDHLSGGEAQLTALLRALQFDPTVFLLDEPTASLDSATSIAIERLVGLWHEEAPHRRSFIWVTHDLEQSRRISSTAWRVEAGQLQTED